MTNAWTKRRAVALTGGCVRVVIEVRSGVGTATKG